MNLSLSPCRKAELRRLLTEAGAFRAGFAAAGDISEAARTAYRRWLADGCHASMRWMERHEPLRARTDAVLPGARTVIVAAFPYPAAARHPHIADYAMGEDYHRALRRRLEPVAAHIRSRWGALARVCIDTAPLPERYWAVRAGVGFTGLNGHLYIPGAGAAFVLGEIVTALELPPDAPVPSECTRCGRCVAACPGSALRADGTLDARRCLSYLTIEHRGDLPADARLHGRIYGCDICRAVCPLTRTATPPPPLPELTPRPEIADLTRADLVALTNSTWRRLFADTAISRASAAILRRNARHPR